MGLHFITGFILYHVYYYWQVDTGSMTRFDASGNTTFQEAEGHGIDLSPKMKDMMKFHLKWILKTNKQFIKQTINSTKYKMKS